MYRSLHKGMSTGLTIQSANYAGVDVSGTLTKNIKDGVLSMVVSPSSLNVTDPAPGQVKTLTVNYTVNNGSTNTKTARDNQTIRIAAPSARYASGLQITKAEYGYSGNMTDVTDAVQSLISDGAINMKVSFVAVGIPDPNPRKKKELTVSYTINGESTTETYPDGATFAVSAPPSTSTSPNATPAQNVNSVMSIIFSSFLHFVGIFLYTASIFTSIEYGNQFVSPILWAALAGIIPLFAFIGLPIITFWVRLFTSSDIIIIQTQS
jgi:hypothetical protein